MKTEKYIDPFKYRAELTKTLLEEGGGEINQASPFNTIVSAITNSIVDLNHSLQKTLAITNPILATVKEELFGFLSDRDEQYLFSTPSKTEFTIRLPIKDFYANAILDDAGLIYSLTIPKFSKVLVDDVSFTLLYNVTVDVSKNNPKVYVNYDVQDDTLIYGSQSYGLSSLIVDASGEEWIVFNIQCAQLDIAQYLSNSIAGTVFDQNLPLTDDYFYSTIEIFKDGVYKKIKKHYIDGTYDLQNPSAYVKIGDESINYKIPQPFVDTSLNGKIRTTIFTTKGKMLLDMRGYTNKDFSFIINSNVSNPKEVASQNVNFVVSNTSIVNGGTDATKFQNLKSRIITRCSSRMDIPITEKQLEEVIRREGMIGEIVNDSMLKRTILAKQETWIPKIENATPTTFMNTVHMNKYLDPQDTINISKEYIEFKPNTLFEINGGVVNPVTKSKQLVLMGKTNKEVLKELNNKKYFFNIFTTTIKNDERTTKAEIYDEYNPNFKSFKLKNRNIYSPIKCAIHSYTLNRVKDNLQIKFKMVGNTEYENIKDTIVIQLSLPTIGGTLNLTSEYKVNQTEWYYEINISIANFITNKKLRITNGISTNVNRLVDIEAETTLLVYTKDVNSFNNASAPAKNFITHEELQTNDANKNVVGISRHTGLFQIVKQIPYLWGKSSINTLTKIYKQYTENIPLRYTEDVYKIDPETGSTYFIKDTDGDGHCDTLTREKLHSIGELVLDSNGKQIFAHKVGDYMLDSNNKPILTDDVNYEVTCDMLMMDFRFVVFDDPKFKSYLEELKSLYDNILDKKLTFLNNKTIDNTNIYFKPKNSISKVVTTDDKEYNYSLSPKITIYYDKELIKEKISTNELNVSIGNIIRKYLTKKYFVLKDIETEIEKTLQNAKVVDIVSFTPDNKRAFKLTPYNAFYLDVDLDYVGNMSYKFNLNIEYI